MTYDARSQLKAFHAEHNLNYPLLQDVDTRHVDAYGIRNKDYAPGDRGYGIPHPGVILVDKNGVVTGKLAYPGFRDRPSFEAIYDVLKAN